MTRFNKLRFLIARTLRQEAPLLALSVSRETLLAELDEKSVAIVGNARALEQAQFGARIDAADIIIRINRAPMPAPESHGSRTDWLALATSLSREDALRIKPRRYLWMSHKRKRLQPYVAQSDGFYLHPLDDWKKLGAELGAPPSTGAMIIDLVACSRAKSVALYGFDFFASRSLSGRRRADQVPHDFAAEAAWVQTLASRDARFRLNPL